MLGFSSMALQMAHASSVYLLESDLKCLNERDVSRDLV
jgi:hypothetical protein